MVALAIAACALAAASGFLGVPALLEIDAHRRRRAKRSVHGHSDAGASAESRAGIGGIVARAAGVLRAKSMRENAEYEFPRMLEIIVLGLQAGLSFDQSFGLYLDRFDTPLARRCRVRCIAWLNGLEKREDALRGLASTLDIDAFYRLSDVVVFALQFGVPLAPLLSSLADDARKTSRAHIQERILKAGTKMLVPTGVLILPAMLVLVMGPAVLQMAEEFL